MTTPPNCRTVHAYCAECRPPSSGPTFLAVCGETGRSVLGIEVEDVDDIPPDLRPCPACVQLFDEPCPWCGAE